MRNDKDLILGPFGGFIFAGVVSLISINHLSFPKEQFDPGFECLPWIVCPCLASFVIDAFNTPIIDENPAVLELNL